jgi:Tol biopolymer transport system component
MLGFLHWVLAGVLAVAVDSLPLVPTRRVHFKTSEGTWMSLDVSPDGRAIIFDLLGQLYALPLAGGKAKAITSGMAFNAQPRFSPDGRHIVFTSDRDGWVNVWIAKSDGTQARQITHFYWSDGRTMVASPVWTPDGRSVVVSERIGGLLDGMRLAEYAIRGGRAIAVTHRTSRDSAEKSEYRGATFGDDSNIVYAATKSSDDYSAYWQIVSIDRRTGASRRETSALSGLSAMRPVVSPNGRYLVFGSPSGNGLALRLRDRVTGSERWLTHPRLAQRMVSTGLRDSRDLMPASAFTPDSREVITSYDGKLWRVRVADGFVKSIPFWVDVDQPVGPLARFEYRITDSASAIHGIQQPALSPDGTKIAFTALDRLWITSTSGEAPRRLTNALQGEFFPAWSPDGEYIAYAVWSDSFAGALYRVRADGTSPPQQLTSEPAFFTKPTYTSDGGQIVAVRGLAQAFRGGAVRAIADSSLHLELISIPASGGELRRIMDLRTPHDFLSKFVQLVHGRPQPTANGIAMYDADSGLASVGLELYHTRTLLRSVTHKPGGVSRPLKVREVLLSPSGQYALALASMSDRPYLFSMPDSSSMGSSAVSLTDTNVSSPGVHVWQLSTTGADFIGWTFDDRPYFSVGNAIFIAETPLTIVQARAPTFRRLSIELVAAPDRAQGTLLLRGARLLTMRGNETIDHGDLLIRNGRIAALGPRGSVTAPPGAKILDVTGNTILPGYVDVHDHVYPSISYGVHLTSEPRLLVDLAYGITTLRDPQGFSTDLMVYGERSAMGDLIAPRIFTVTTSVFPQLFADGKDQTLPETRKVLRRWSDSYESQTLKQYLAGGRRTRQLIAMAAYEQRLTPTNEGGQDSEMDLTEVFDGYGAIEHLTLATPQFNDIVQLFARSGTIKTPTLGLYLGWQPMRRTADPFTQLKMEHFFPPTGMADLRRFIELIGLPPDDAATVYDVASPYARIMAAGGCVGMGSHGNIPGLGAHYELWYLARGGMSNYDVLRSGTICSATSIGHGKDLGSLERGKLADLQILNKNPIDDITNTLSLRYVMKDGRLFDAGTLAEVWPRQRSLPKQWWCNQKPR